MGVASTSCHFLMLPLDLPLVRHLHRPVVPQNKKGKHQSRKVQHVGISASSRLALDEDLKS